MAAETTTITIENNIPKIIKGLSEKQIGALGDTIGGLLEGALVDRIHEGDSGWAPLSEAWAEHKGHGNQWYYTGTLGGAIKYERDGNAVYVGIIDAGSYRNGENVATVAMKLEYGSSGDNVPARPLFIPVAKENEDAITKEALAYVNGLIKSGKI